MPDVSLNGIEFIIKGSSDAASKSVEKLTQQLGGLKEVLGKLGDISKSSAALKTLAEEIPKIKNALKGGTKGMEDFANRLANIATAAKSLGENSTHIAELSQAMSTMSGVKVGSKQLENVATGIKAVADSAQGVSKETIDNLERMTSSLAKLSGVDLKGLGSAMNAVGKGKSLAPPVPVSEELQDIVRTGNQVDLLKLKLMELQDQLEQAFNKGDLSGAIRIQQQINNVTKEIEKLEAEAKKAANGSAEKFEGLRSTLSTIANTAKTAGKTIAIAVGKGLAFPFTSAAKSIGGFAKSIGGVVGGFKRILGYRLIRTLIKEVGQAFGEGIKNLYGWSKAFGGATVAGRTFAQAMDSISTSGAYFKNSIGAMVGPLISSLAPAIDFVVDKIVALINVLNQLFAMLGGATSWNRAVRKANEFEEAAGGAGAAAKEALRYLAPFDELNVLPDDKKRGGGGGGGTDYAGMFEETTEFAEGVKDFAQGVKAAIEASDWQGLGQLLGNKVNELIDGIDFAGAGRKVGEFINAWFTTRYWTLKTINFQNIGSKIAEFLNNALAAIDFETIGRSFAQKFTILPDLIIGFIENADWSLIGSSIGSYIRGALDEWAEWLRSNDWEAFGSKLVQSIGDAIAGIDIAATAQSIKNFLVSAWNAGVALLSGALKALFTGGTIQASSSMSADISVSGLNFSDGTGKKAAAWRTALVNALPYLVTAIGFKVGGVQGAVFGAAIGLGIKSAIEAFSIVKGGGDPSDASAVAQAIVDALPLLGAAIGLVVGGPGGALLGATLGIGLWFAIQKIDWKNKESPTGSAGGGTALGGANVRELTQSLQTDVQTELDNHPVSVTGQVDFAWSQDPVTYEWTYGPVEIPATAKVTSATNATSGNLSVNATAKFTDINRSWSEAPWLYTYAWFTAYGIKESLRASNGTLKVDATANITQTTGHVVVGGNIGTNQANGGVYSGGRWHDIARYASGGLPSGSQLFWARERGPELVGTLGGHAAVMNNDQIVASVSAGVARAISGIRFHMTGMPVAQQASEPERFDEEAMYRAFSRALADSDLGGDINLDGEPIYRNVVRRNRQNTRATGVNQLAMA